MDSIPAPPVLVTGAAGFIGFHVAKRLLARGEAVLGVDNLNGYYDVRLKRARLRELRRHEGFEFRRVELADREATRALFDGCAPERVVHLAAQAGVRHSLDNPAAYVDANVVALGNVLEGCRHARTQHLLFASSSSVYGAAGEGAVDEANRTDRPISLYAATKAAGEAMAYAYAHLYGLPVTALRFFTVYGPWGRPDMAYFLFADAIEAGLPIQLYNGGQMKRDFTYVGDVAEGVVRALYRPASGAVRNGTPEAPYNVYNVGSDRPVELSAFVRALEDAMGREARKEMLPMQPGDMPSTHAAVERLRGAVGYQPKTPLEEGLRAFVDWYRRTWLAIARGEGAGTGPVTGQARPRDEAPEADPGGVERDAGAALPRVA